MQSPAPRRLIVPAVALSVAVFFTIAAASGNAAMPGRPDAAPAVPTAPVAPVPIVGAPLRITSVDDLPGADTLRGRSGKLLARFIGGQASRSMAIPALQRLFGEVEIRQAGSMVSLEVPGSERPFAFLTLRPFSDKRDGRVGPYRIGFWPAERGRQVSAAYRNPPGFIEVTRENADLYISENFRLRDFLTKDQHDVWPKYLVLREDLVDKLELLIDELRRSGVAVKRMRVMSGFRTPQYNAAGNNGGRSSVSRHMYGDAADVFIDNNGNGRMDDLNGDGRVDYRDAQLIVQAVERVERRYPDLIGGAGLYRTGAYGPFVHVDVRGTRARW